MDEIQNTTFEKGAEPMEPQLRLVPITLHYTTFHLNDNIILLKNVGLMVKEDNNKNGKLKKS